MRDKKGPWLHLAVMAGLAIVFGGVGALAAWDVTQKAGGIIAVVGLVIAFLWLVADYIIRVCTDA